eukprot:Skav213338  [mRNA]  locus=scaffold3340:407585:410409:+ [translate_table: standard]
MQAVPPGPQHRAERETARGASLRCGKASTLFLLMAEEEQEEKLESRHRVTVLEMQQSKQQEQPEVDAKDKRLGGVVG